VNGLVSTSMPCATGALTRAPYQGVPSIRICRAKASGKRWRADVLLPLRQLAIRRLDLLDRSIPGCDPLGTCRVRIQQAGFGTA